MTDQPNAPAEVAGEDTAAVLNFASGEKTYLEAQPEPEAAEAEPEKAEGDETEDLGDEAAAAQDEGKPKPKKTAQDRFDELTRARREAERDAEYWKAKALQSQAQPAQEAQTEHQPEENGRPVREDYADDFEFIEALTDWKAEQAAERLVTRQRQQAEATRVQETFESRSKTLYPDGEPAGLLAFRELSTLPGPIIAVVAESEVGPKIAEHLGDNPAELKRLSGLNPIQQVRELTLLETRLTPREEAKPPPKTATTAPEPAPMARGAGGRFQVAADTSDFAAFEKQYLRSGG